MIDNIPRTQNISAIYLRTDGLVNALKQCCREWKSNYAEDLHIKAKTTLYTLTDNIRNYSQCISKEVREIDSLGQVMSYLDEIR